MDKISLRGMVFHAHHGVYPAERELGQRFEVDLEVGLDLGPAGRTDDLSLGLDYSRLYLGVKEIVQGRRFNLIEALAEAVAAFALEFDAVREVAVRVRKPQAPLPGVFGTVEVQIQRSREWDAARAALEGGGPEVTAYLGLGSNLGDKRANLREAVRLLSEKVAVTGASSLYETAPVGYLEQDWFLNAVIGIQTRLRPLELLGVTQDVERALGRRRSVRWGPRIIDVDILTYDDERVDEPGLVIPHPGIGDRLFVLEPLLEIWPDAVLPDGRRLAEIREGIAGTQEIRKVPGPFLDGPGQLG
ncbi:MAG: 2-amino-4-hydroxy-6-hydroxymethyldihydropteridine diphosphokinase [Actinobacteria bacterium]|nr:2-amino-4-hydroxy-6-hydroxymethyldihydropteridine diphosphokinase [Actinomycetota bacterium]